jgi:hypothetical protein
MPHNIAHMVVKLFAVELTAIVSSHEVQYSRLDATGDAIQVLRLSIG